MRFSAAATTCASVIGAMALSLPTVSGCLLESDANTLATNFGLLVSNYSQKLANETLAKNFVDYSESVNSLIDNGGTAPVALLGETFSSRAAFESLSSQQAAVPFQVKNLWYTCDTITVRWESAQSPEPVIGISVLETVLAPLGQSAPGTLYQISEVYGEFDSAAWLVNLGVFKPASSKQRRGVAFEA